MRPHPRVRAGRFAAFTLAAALACAPPPAREDAARDERIRAFGVRRALEDARQLRRLGRHEAAEGVARRGLALAPDDAALHRELARALAAQGDASGADLHFQRADALAPPPPPPPDAALDGVSEGLLIVLLPPAVGETDATTGSALRERIALRLPGARFVEADPASAAEGRALAEGARAAISLRAERARCGESIKDGPYSVADLRAAGAVRGADAAASARAHASALEAEVRAGCEAGAVARALERAFETPTVRTALSAPATGEVWSGAALRSLFPEIERRATLEIAAGRRWLAVGELALAREAFERALAVDPEHPDALAFHAEVDATQAIARALPGSRDDARLPARIDGARRAAAERALAAEESRRRELLAALATLAGDERTLDALLLEDALGPAELRDPESFGARVARERAGGEIEVRAAYAPDGEVLARFYFAPGADRLLLREDDLDRDARPDRWTAYRGAERAEVWEDGDGLSWPDLHVRFATGGAPERAEVDLDGDGRAERVLEYDAGLVARESVDTDGDGRLDRTDRFGPDGRVGLREEDLDGDGRVDVRSVYREGRLLRREIESPVSAPGT